MSKSGDKNDFQKLLWSIPIILFIHNLEEALTMPQWMLTHFPMLRTTIPFFEHLQFSVTQLYASLFLVTLIPFLVTFFCLRGERTTEKISILLVLQAIIFWNALVPHISGLFVLEMYNPGTITAVLLNVPFSIYLYRRVKQEELIPKNTIRNCIFIGLAAYLPIVYLNHLVAQTITLFI
ncbi:MAG: HXXEE domain-containing protein [Bacteroidota bacterium]|nr:HXXEE domain-containing protein [Bacteroidota bacterium]